MSSLVVSRGSGSLPRLPEHRNPGLELVIVERGTLTWQVEGRTHRVPPGSVFFTLPWQRHGSALEFEPGHRWSYVVLRLEEIAPRRRVPFRFPAAYGFRPDEARRLTALLAGAASPVAPAGPSLSLAVRELAAKLPAGLLPERRTAALATLAIVELARVLAHAPPPSAESTDAHRVRRVVDAFRADLERRWTLADAAALARLGKSRFSEIFQRETGDAPMTFLNRLRIDHARTLLRRSDARITDVALACGFASSQYFCRIFRRFTGVPASHYRASAPPAASARVSRG